MFSIYLCKFVSKVVCVLVEGSKIEKFTCLKTIRGGGGRLGALDEVKPLDNSGVKVKNAILSYTQKILQTKQREDQQFSSRSRSIENLGELTEHWIKTSSCELKGR